RTSRTAFERPPQGGLSFSFTSSRMSAVGTKRTSSHFFSDDPVKHKRSSPFAYDTDRNSNDCIYEAQQWLLPSILGVARRNNHDNSGCNCRQANLVASP